VKWKGSGKEEEEVLPGGRMRLPEGELKGRGGLWGHVEKKKSRIGLSFGALGEKRRVKVLKRGAKS
jgi:hypothetical protein